MATEQPALDSNLPAPKTLITGHDAAGKAVVQESRPAAWKVFEEGAMGFNQIYTNLAPAELNGDADIRFHDDKIASGTLGLVVKGGSGAWLFL